MLGLPDGMIGGMIRSCRWVLAMMMLMFSLLGAQPRPSATASSGTFFALSVADIDASVKWYCDLLGFAILSQGASPDGSTRFALLRRNNDLVEIVQRKSAVHPPSMPDRSHEWGIFKTGFWVEDLRAMESTLREKGAVFSHGIVTPRGANYQTFAVKDPDGNIVQFFGNSSADGGAKGR